MWFTTTGWIMWNYLVSGLLSDTSIVLFDGNPGYPDLGRALGPRRRGASDTIRRRRGVHPRVHESRGRPGRRR